MAAFSKLRLDDMLTRFSMKHHQFVLCKYDKARKLKVVIDSHRMVVLTIPYGIKHDADYKGFTRPSELAIAIIRALIDLVHQVHLSDLSLDGNFSVKNLYWLRNKQLKLSGLKRSDFLPKTDARAKKDFSSVCSLIRNILFEGYHVPGELNLLIRLMEKDPIAYEHLILNNIILLDDVKKIGEYISCYQTLQQLKLYNEMIYRVALTFISNRRKWKTYVLDNSALKSVFDYNGSSAYKATTPEESATTFGRHSCSHILDYSVDTSLKIILFTIADVFAIIECFLPGLFAEVQRAVFEVTHILFPRQLEAMTRTSSGGDKLPKPKKAQKQRQGFKSKEDKEV